MASEDSYTTVSENSTTDTSILSVDSADTDNEISLNIGSDEPAISVSSYDSSDEDETHETGYITSNHRHSSTSDMSVDWDTTYSSVETSDSPREFNIIARLNNLDTFISTSNVIARNTRLQTSGRQDQEARRMQAFRERSWSLEECSICFDVILKDQEVMALPCTHQFHAACVLPWLEQRQTCPNCRKSVD